MGQGENLLKAKPVLEAKFCMVSELKNLVLNPIMNEQVQFLDL